MQELLFPPSFGFINRQPPPPPPPTSFADELKSCVTDPLSCRELSAAVAVAAVLVTLVLLRRNTARKSKRESNAARNDEIAAYHEAHSIDIEPTVLSLLRARWGRAHWYDVSPKEALASVLMQLGEKAWILLSTATALLAIGVQWLAQHVQKRRSSSAFGGFGAKFEAMAAQMLSRAEKLVARARFSIVAASLFDKADKTGDHDGTISPIELYCLVLQLYTQLQMYVRVTAPTKEHTDKLHATFDLDNSGKLDREEFVLLAAVLGENLALRVALQTTIALIAAPLGGAWIVARLAAIPAVAGAAEAAVVAIAPASLEPLLATAATATTLAAATCVAILVPFALSFTDELYVLRAGAKTARALKAARRASVVNQADVLAAVGKSD